MLSFKGLGEECSIIPKARRSGSGKTAGRVSGSRDQKVMERRLTEKDRSDICGFLSSNGIWSNPLNSSMTSSGALQERGVDSWKLQITGVGPLSAYL